MNTRVKVFVPGPRRRQQWGGKLDNGRKAEEINGGHDMNTITDPGPRRPKRLRWAYSPSVFLLQNPLPFNLSGMYLSFDIYLKDFVLEPTGWVFNFHTSKVCRDHCTIQELWDHDNMSVYIKPYFLHFSLLTSNKNWLEAGLAEADSGGCWE